MAITLGIDFGTSYTFLVKKDESGKLTVIGRSFYRQMSGGEPLAASYGIRTAIGYGGDDSAGNPIWYIGDQVWGKEEGSGRLLCLKENRCDELKIRIRAIFKGRGAHGKLYVRSLDEIPQLDVYGKTFFRCKADGTPIYNTDGTRAKFFMDAIKLSEIFFQKALCDSQGGYAHGNDDYYAIRDVEKVVIGVPADEMEEEDGISSHNYNAVVREIFGRVLRAINLQAEVVIGAEPVFAVNAYIKNFPQETKDGNLILVVDVGGGTADFVLVERTKHGYSVLHSAKGGGKPAGESFDKRLKKLLLDRGVEVSDASIVTAKEELFRSRRMFDYDEHGALRDPCDAEDLYEEYMTSGRRYTMMDATGKMCVVSFNRDHDGGYTNSVPFETEFRSVCSLLTSKLKRYLNDAYEALKEKNMIVGDYLPIDLLLFVGGTCNMRELREIVKREIGIEENYSSSGFKRNGRKVGVLFWEVGEGTEDEVPLNASNMIAIGAAFHQEMTVGDALTEEAKQAVKNEVAISISDIYIQARAGTIAELKTMGKDGYDEFFIFSQVFKNMGYDPRFSTGGTRKWPLILTCFPGEEKLEFRIRVGLGSGKSIIYPQGPVSYSVRLPADIPQDGLDFLFFVDASSKGELSLFVCVLDHDTTEKMPKVVLYKFKCVNGKQLTIKDMKGVRARKKNFRMYLIKDPEKKEMDGIEVVSERSEGTQGKVGKQRGYSIITNRLGFGWITTENGGEI